MINNLQTPICFFLIIKKKKKEILTCDFLSEQVSKFNSTAKDIRSSNSYLESLNFRVLSICKF